MSCLRVSCKTTIEDYPEVHKKKRGDALDRNGEKGSPRLMMSEVSVKIGLPLLLECFPVLVAWIHQQAGWLRLPVEPFSSESLMSSAPPMSGSRTFAVSLHIRYVFVR